MDVMEKIKRLKDEEVETKVILRHLEYIKNCMEKITVEEICLFVCLERRFNDRLTEIRKKLDNIYEIINLANEL